ncbi:MAG: lipopolysaccharide biosynthesis protein [Bacteroidales bacterium]|nr:lipopolysaccharide biosynthesis protein [Bacteroidales bacterium]
MSESSLRNKTIKGTFWSAADAFLGQGITFVVGIVLARLLSPEEYGMIGICLIFTTILNGIVDSGFSNAIIRKKEASNEDYNTMFITNMVVSIVLYVLLYFSAPLISSFFQMELTSIVRVIGLVLIINGLSLTQQTNLTKKIDFKTKTKASIVSAILSGVIGIGMAYAGFGVWALVAQLLSKQTVYTIALWTLNRWMPNFHFSVESFKYMWGFGWKLLVSGLLDRLWAQMYQVVVGKFYNAATLGQYTRGREYANIFSANITSIVQRVTYPVLAEVQDEKERMVSAYRKVIKVTMFVTCVCMISLGAVAEPLIYCLIGEKWHQAATFLPLICISMSLYPLHAINLNMLQVQGRSDIFLYLEIVKKIIAIGPLCIGIFFDIYWMLIGSIVTGFICFFLNTYYTGKKLGYSSWKQLKDIVPSYGVALVIALAVYFLKYLPLSHWIVLPMQIAVGILVFFAVCETIKLSEYIEIKNIAISAVNKIRKR